MCQLQQSEYGRRCFSAKMVQQNGMISTAKFDCNAVQCSIPVTRLKSGPTGTQKSTAWNGDGTPAIGVGIGSTGTTVGATAACIAIVSVAVVVSVVDCCISFVVVVSTSPICGVVCAAGFTERSTGASSTC